jgi:adenosylcobinamide-GDP ribazoletransferase
MRQAIQFLTTVPVPAPAGPPGRCAWAFPLVGVGIGLVAAVFLRVHPGLGPLIALIAVALLTGGLHDDGLADVFDGVRAGRSCERMLAIMKDSRVGAHGALALIAAWSWRWQALTLLNGNAWLRIPAAFGISRALLVVLAATAPPAGDGLGRAFCESLPRHAPALAAIQALILAALCGPLAGAAMVVLNALTLLALRRWFMARLGGVNGDCLGAACLISECVSLGVLACV